MKAECQDCGKKLKELYWSKFIEPEETSQIIVLEDFFYCPWCNKVYRREIQTEVLWHKLDCLEPKRKRKNEVNKTR